MATEIPEVVVQRLPHYLRALRVLRDEGTEVVSSQELGQALGVTPAQIRKDLSYFGRFGKQGRGYNVQHLLQDLTKILGLERSWPVILVGVGRLGRAIVTYPGFTPEGFHIQAAFDTDPAIIGKRVATVEVRPLEEMPDYVLQEEIEIAIVAVPGDYAPKVINELVGAGVRAILNYAPITPRVPAGVRIQTIDPVQALQTMTFHLREAGRFSPPFPRPRDTDERSNGRK
jgi:redox-sensing transcriptional repressor